MIINRALFIKNRPQCFEEDVVFSEELIKKEPIIKDIKDAHVVYEIVNIDNILQVKIDFQATLILIDAYNLKDVTQYFDIKEIVNFVSNEEEINDNNIFIRENKIDLNNVLFGLLISELPMAPKNKDSQMPKSGVGYRVLSEDEYQKEKSGRQNPQFDVLKNIEFDD